MPEPPSRSGAYRSVWKFAIPDAGEFELEMPSLARVIHVDVRHGRPCLWALVEPGHVRTMRTFYLRGTGHAVEAGLVHLGSFVLHDGDFVGHLFEPIAAHVAALRDSQPGAPLAGARSPTPAPEA
jgi:hypothetical protein